MPIRIFSASDCIQGCPLVGFGNLYSEVKNEEERSIFIFDPTILSTEMMLAKALRMTNFCGRCLKCKEPKLMAHTLDLASNQPKSYFGVETQGIIGQEL